ncbi:MAG: PIN domain-containing protein [Ilumatobacteraceae bacterium]
MTAVLDAYAVLALLKGEAAADEVGELLSTGAATMTPLGVAEAMDHLVRLAGVDPDEAALDLAQLGLLDPAPLTGPVARRAGVLRAAHYHRTKRAVSLADCVAAETARELDAPLATADPHLLELCHDDGIRSIVLVDARGNRWSP